MAPNISGFVFIFFVAVPVWYSLLLILREKNQLRNAILITSIVLVLVIALAVILQTNPDVLGRLLRSQHQY
jgi:hypothetical protein